MFLPNQFVQKHCLKQTGLYHVKTTNDRAHNDCYQSSMPTLFAVFTAFILSFFSVLVTTNTAYAEFDPIMASAMSESSDPVTEAEQTETVSANLDPIETYALAGFKKQKELLVNWQFDEASFTKLKAYLDADQLYKTANQVFIYKDKIYYDYKTNKPVEWMNGMEQVTLNNELRTVLNVANAKNNLASKSLDKRFAAVAEMSSNPANVSIDFLNTQIAKQDNAKVKEKLGMLLARKQLADKNLNENTLLNAVKTLSASDNPEVMALLKTVKQGNDYTQAVKSAAAASYKKVKSSIDSMKRVGHIFSGLSTASILLLAALGLAITYGLLGVINMAHGELIMIGAYATYVVQTLFSKYMPDMGGFYLLAAIPVAFIVSALVGILIERIVVKPLYGRQLETLLATFGVSLILIQLTRMIFGAQNVAVESVSWLSGGVHLSSSIILPYNRIAIIVFTLLVLACIKFLISYTRFGLFVRAVTQNRGMARAVGVPSSRIDMMAFGLGSGIAGLAGCALAQIGNVGPDLGQNLIVDTFLVVVVGGVGQLAGAALASLGLGLGGTFLEVGIGAVLAKIVLLALVILFIQKRPQGLFSVKGRFVDD